RNLLEPAVVWGDSPPEAEAVVFTPEDCWALRRGRMHWVEDSQYGLPCQHLSRAPSASYLCVPMMALGQALGVLFLQSPPKPNQPERPLGLVQESKQRLALTVAEHTALALANLKLRENLRTQSIRDPLTGLFNRRYMEESLERELHRLARRRRGLGLIMLDLDHFKSFNDSLGHEAGDTVLRELGHFVQSRTRQEDIACRYGGEEFTLILPEASLEVTRQRAERLREDVKQLNVQYLGQILRSDLDHFKSFNDSLGHEAGDTVLRELGHFVQSRTRQEDIACRYGGEEFTLILPEASLEVTRQRAERLREDVKQLNVQYLGQIL